MFNLFVLKSRPALGITVCAARDRVCWQNLQCFFLSVAILKTQPQYDNTTPSSPHTSARSSATQVRSGPTTSSMRDSARGTSTKRRYFWFGDLLALVSDLLWWLACFSALVSRKHCFSDSRISQRGITIKPTVNQKICEHGCRRCQCKDCPSARRQMSLYTGALDHEFRPPR